MHTRLSTILSQSINDIPVWARVALVLIGLAGIVVIVVASLTGHHEQTIKVDKLLHFGGYATLALIFVVGLRPALYLPALLLLALLSIAIEYIQPMNARAFDTRDMLSNLVGLAAGFALGLVIRIVWRVLQTSMKRNQLAKHRRNYSAGAIILQQGSSVQKFFVIEQGEVQLSRVIDGKHKILGRMGAGDLIGLLGVLQDQPQYTTVEAIQPTTVLCLNMKDLVGSSGTLDEPMRSVLAAMSKQLRALADRVGDVEVFVR